ncbi:unnamed protein product [Heligmosomoides polygyrus]|uniref:Reverse transcriptase domain-containing protein n=1 Tax=Heligmosomoides polygyrus TaxID=6339 RepID=A0A183FWB1_HELPZ|nr:unnamed protein product [Heligmosomoides polygyrus]
MGKEDGKKKAVDPFARQRCFEVEAPSMFYNRQVDKTLTNKTQGTKTASEGQREVCSIMIPDFIGTDIEKAYHGLYSLQAAVLILKRPRLDLGSMMRSMVTP